MREKIVLMATKRLYSLSELTLLLGFSQEREMDSGLPSWNQLFEIQLNSMLTGAGYKILLIDLFLRIPGLEDSR